MDCLERQLHETEDKNRTYWQKVNIFPAYRKTVIQCEWVSNETDAH